MTITEVVPQGGAEFGGSATTSFVHGSEGVASDIVVEWDFDNDGDFDESEEDITSLVLACETTIGRDFPSQLTGKSQPGQFKATLRNDDNRFSIFNTASPLKQGDFDLKVGRKLRVRTSDATNPDPALIVRDRFRRTDGAAGTTPTGQTWFNSDATTPLSTSRYRIENEQLTHQDQEATWFAVLDTGVADYYFQTTISQTGRPTSDGGNIHAGILFRYADGSNFTQLAVDSDITGSGSGESLTLQLQLIDVVAGVGTELDVVAVPALYDDLTIGVRVSGTEVRVYWEGVHVITETAINTTETHVGITSTWNDLGPAPRYSSFWVWDDLPQSVDGILWTGSVTDVKPNVTRGPKKLAEISGIGVLDKATQNKIDLPAHVEGEVAGRLVGATLAQAELSFPPGPHQSIDEGTITSSAIAPIEDNQALNVLRKWEAFEFGFIHELPEGYIAFDERSARLGTSVSAVFSDDEAAQFHYESIDLKDWAKEVINRTQVGVGPRVASNVSRTVRSNVTAAFTQNHVDVQMPVTVNDGDLLIVVIASTVATTGQIWNTPIWWVEARGLKGDEADTIAMRVYWHHSDGSEDGDTIRFYNDSASAGGAWIAHVIKIPDGEWFGDHEQGGPVIGEFGRRDSAQGTVIAGSDPRSISPQWGFEPSLFLAMRVGLTSLTGAGLSDETYPQGYRFGTSTFLNGSTNGADAAIQTAWKVDSKTSEDPGQFTGFSNFIISEVATIAVRSFNGPSTELRETVLGPVRVPLSSRFKQTFHDRDSQEDHNFIRTSPDSPEIFAFDSGLETSTDAENYADVVLATFSDDRPILSITFTANKSASYRAQAFRRRVGDKITLIADGNSGLGISQDFFIENISHRFSEGTTLWEVTWQLSPA